MASPPCLKQGSKQQPAPKPDYRASCVQAQQQLEAEQQEHTETQQQAQHWEQQARTWQLAFEQLAVSSVDVFGDQP